MSNDNIPRSFAWLILKIILYTRVLVHTLEEKL